MAPAWSHGRGSIPHTGSVCSPTVLPPLLNSGTEGRRASTWWWLKTRQPPTISSFARSARVIRGQYSACLRHRTNLRPRSRAVIDPRGVLREFGVTLADDVQVRVWDSTAEIRYLVLPRASAGNGEDDRGRVGSSCDAQRDRQCRKGGWARRSRYINGIHDMGGMQDMGPIEVREAERPFHAEWEARAWGLIRATGPFGPTRRRNFRYEHEILPPAQYLQMRYFERFIKLLVNRLIAAKLLTQTELDSGRAESASPRLTPRVTPANIAEQLTRRRSLRREDVKIRPQFSGPTRAGAQHQPGRAHAPPALHAGP